ncbi:hypothetical protein B0T20DRAFT_160108 [Sordaria brevicollis]|uniref:Zn(2)-C6 fungal-type domain-containing protein n=1 Tax=Sordaria brevicollis TaxID=83679 RepID=A0AAE0PJK2_SORBR|nr:hypothetical protein B0T20DRAFT_160108 [Sordaria brevicollis]
MVGVPGKYKGCNSCRVRRVKCDNSRPYCRKCIDSGRECLGYERETVFIIGTIEDGGRCSSHPPRVIKSRKGKASTSSRSGGEGEDDEKEGKTPPRKEEGRAQRLELFPDHGHPLQSAWDDFLSVSTGDGRRCSLRFEAVNTRLRSVVRGGDGRSDGFAVKSMAEYEVPNLGMYFGGQEFELRGQCLVSLPGDQDGDAYWRLVGECVFVYEHNNSTPYTNLYNNQPKDFAVQSDPIRRVGSENLQIFPDHHFFVRVYRPNAILSALLNRVPTFLESAEWTSIPWGKHPKSILDQLLDIIAILPRTLWRADRVAEEVPSLPRRQRAQDLLNNCLNIERQFNAWSAGFSAEMTAFVSRQSTAVITPSSSSTSMGEYGGPVQSYLATPPAVTAYDYLSPSSSPYPQSQGQGQHRRSPSNSVSRSRGTPSPTPSASASSPRFQPYPMNSPHQQAKSRRTSPSYPVQYPYPSSNPPLVFANSQLALAYILYHISLMQLYQTIERLYWSIFESLPMGTPLEVQMQMQQLPMDFMNNVDLARYGTKAVRGLAERVCRSLESALSNGAEPGLLAYPLYWVRSFYESVGMGSGIAMGITSTSWDGLGVDIMGMGGPVGGNSFNMGMNMNNGMAGSMAINYSAGMENLNMMGLDGLNNNAMIGTTATAMMQRQQQQSQSQPQDGRLELMWCDQFRERLRAKGSEITNSIMGQGKKWEEIASYGY